MLVGSGNETVISHANHGRCPVVENLCFVHVGFKGEFCKDVIQI